VERAKAFYERLGWRLDADFITEQDRGIQFTPPGSQGSVHFGTSLTTAAPGSAQAILIVSDVQAARNELVRRGVAVSEVFHYAGFNRVDPEARLGGPAPERQSYGSWVSFSDPDGNAWLVQEVTTRLPGRVAGETTYASVADLAGALRRASEAHGEHEKRTGQYDANWPDWYAAYMVAEATGGELPT
jgi:predicted enzyme related to lactoylglutathione lyase